MALGGYYPGLHAGHPAHRDAVAGADPVTIFEQMLTANDIGQGGQTNRNVVPITSPSLGQVRVTFEASTIDIFAVNNASIGQWAAHAAPDNGNFGGTTAIPIPLLFGGQSGFSISNGATITSDWATVADLADWAVVVVDHAAASFARYIGGLGAPDAGGAAVGFNQGASFLSADPCISSLSGRIIGVNKIETR